MITQIDHVIVLAEHLDTAISNAQTAGFTVHPGGVHHDQATHNALIPFNDGSYIEIISFVSTPPPNHYFGERYRQGSGLTDVGLLSTDIDIEVQDITDSGLPFPIPTHFGRHCPDGRILTWRMSLPGNIHPCSGFPFLIQDITDRALRVPSGPATSHPNGALGIAGVTFLVDNIDTADAHFRAILGSGTTSRTDHFRGRGLSLIPIESGATSQWLGLMQPVAESAPQRYMETFGQGAYAISLQTVEGSPMYPGSGELISPELVEGARFYLQRESEV